MNTLDLPRHTRDRLLTTGSALHLSPMEPQPELIYGRMVWNKTGEWITDRNPLVGAVWDPEKNPLDTGAAGMVQLAPHKPGDVLIALGPGERLVGNFDVRPLADFVASGQSIVCVAEKRHARCESVTPLRLSEISEEQARDMGWEPPQMDLVSWWHENHLGVPWHTSWAWLTRWMLEAVVATFTCPHCRERRTEERTLEQTVNREWCSRCEKGA